MNPRRALLLTAVLAAGPTLASDGVVEINASRAAAGAITPGDAPGYPVTLSLPGSYQLTGPLNVPDVATTAIHVTATPVALDLGGFAISGPVVCTGEPAVCGGSGIGVGVDAAATAGTVVRNGVVRGMGDAGVRLGPGSRVEGLRALSNGGIGISVGRTSLVSSSMAEANGDAGVGGDAEHVIVTGTTAVANVSSGFALGRGSIVRASTALNNGFHGIDFGAAAPPGERAIFEGNTLRGNGGFAVSGGAATGGNVCDDVVCSPRGARRFYLSINETTGANALSICTPGFHMASLWEIHEPAQLAYDPNLGLAVSDAGAGPPSWGNATSAVIGWVRTGNSLTGGANAGVQHCSNWTTTAGFGSAVGLQSFWDTAAGAPDTWPWRPILLNCSTPTRVWCVED